MWRGSAGQKLAILRSEVCIDHVLRELNELPECMRKCCQKFIKLTNITLAILIKGTIIM